MDPKIFKLSSIVLLLLFIGESCNKDEWTEINLTNNRCEDNLTETTDIISEQMGTITLFGTSGDVYYITCEPFEDWPQGVLFAPCNLPHQIVKEGQKIIFSGEISGWLNYGNDSIAIDYFGIPIILSNAKINNR